VKAKVQIRIATIAAVIFTALCIYQRMIFWLSSGIDVAIILDLITIPAIYALYVYALMTERLRLAKWIYIIWWLNALRPVLFSALLLRGHQFAQAFLIWFQIGVMGILLWMGINGLKQFKAMRKPKVNSMEAK